MPKIKTFSAVLLLALAMLGATYLYGDRLKSSNLELHQTFERPDGLYRVEVWRHKQKSMMPGQASDAPGVVSLLDKDGHMLAEAPVEMVQNADAVDWSNNHASIKLVVDWDLAALPPAP